MREAQVNIAIRWFIGYGLHERLPDHSSLTRIRQRWGEKRFREIFRRTVRACLDAKVAKGEVVHVDASLIRADVSWESLVERHVDEVMSENAGEEKDEGGGGLSGKGKSAKVSGTDPDASMATLANTRRHEPCYKQHAAVDDERGVVLDVSVTTGAVSERKMVEAQVDSVCEITERGIATVTGDAGYAYAGVYGGLERRGIDAVIPVRRDPPRSRVPLRRFRYDARCPLRSACLPQRVPAALGHEEAGCDSARLPGAAPGPSPTCEMERGRAAHVPASPLALGGLPRGGEDLARAGTCGASGYRQHEDTVLPDGGGDQSQAARRRSSCKSVLPLEGRRRRESPVVCPSRQHALDRPPVGRHSLSLQAGRSETRFFNSPIMGRLSPSAKAREAKECRKSLMRTSWRPACARMGRQ